MKEKIINFWKNRTLPKAYQHFPKDLTDLNDGQLAALKVSKEIWENAQVKGLSLTWGRIEKLESSEK